MSKMRESREIRYIRNFIIAVSKCVMKKYDKHGIGQFNIKVGSNYGYYSINCDWGKFYSKYLEQQKTQ